MRTYTFPNRRNAVVTGVPNQVTDEMYENCLFPGATIQAYSISGRKPQPICGPVTITEIDGDFLVGVDSNGRKVVAKLGLDLGITQLPDTEEYHGLYATGLVTR